MASFWQQLVSSNNLWKLCAAGATVPAFAAGYKWRAQENFKKQPYYQKAVELIKQAPGLDDVMGQFDFGAVKLGLRSPNRIREDQAEFEIPITGKKDSGVILCNAVKEDGNWVIKEMAAKLKKSRKSWTFYKALEDREKNMDDT